MVINVFSIQELNVVIKMCIHYPVFSVLSMVISEW